MIRIVVVIVVTGLAACFALLLKRRTDAPIALVNALPVQLDRADFIQPNRTWLVVVFTSATCNTCADIEAKALVLNSEFVAVHIAEFAQQQALHKRYNIDSVPTLLMADAAGVVQKSFMGPVTATDLWAALARVRDTATD